MMRMQGTIRVKWRMIGESALKFSRSEFAVKATSGHGPNGIEMPANIKVGPGSAKMTACCNCGAE
ncbi:hypothetical protein GL2_37470 [Microbulbifer sp. GL-2]|nr:hypothetical protein GL2_37470 [Microbulbifer sp. GL-2]